LIAANRPSFERFRLAALLLLCATALIVPPSVSAKEIYTNGSGGGDWDESSTWRGGVVPTSEDDAVVSQLDHVHFARNDIDAVTCKNLYIDPKASLIFKTRIGPVTLTLGAAMESSGAVVLDGTRGIDDTMTIRFVNPILEDRRLRIMKGGSLILAGAEVGEGVEANVRMISNPPDVPIQESEAKVVVEDGAGVDLRRSRFENVWVSISDIDNTGASYNERVNVTGNHFVGQGTLFLGSCDSPVVTDNRFERDITANLLMQPALSLSVCPLAEVRNISIRGTYYYGLNCYASTDANVDGMTIDGAYIAVYWYGTDAMIRHLTVRNAATGVMLNYMSGMIDGLVTDNCAQPVFHSVATAQISNWRAERIKEADPTAVLFSQGRLTLLNCDIKPELVKIYPQATPPQNDESGKPLVQCMQFLVAGVKGDMPPGSMVEVKTINPNPPLKPGQMDMNIRNSPAPVMSNRLTPLPGTLQSIVVASWAYGVDRKFIESPKYTLDVLGPPDASGNRQTIKSVPIEPKDDWYRALPDAPVASVEVALP